MESANKMNAGSESGLRLHYCIKNSSRQDEKNRVKWEYGFWELIRNDCAVK